MLGFAGACGWFAVAPLARLVGHPVLLAPLAGLLLLPAGTLLAYVALPLPFAAAATLAASACGALSVREGLAGLRDRPAASLAAAALVALIATLLCQAATLREGEPAILFLWGTDQAGYGQVADWLRQHLATQAPRTDPRLPLQSWPALSFQSDPRFGTYALVALASLATGLPGLFAYDIASTVALAAAVMALAGLGARRFAGVLLLAIALLASQWFDLGRAGYLGKLLGFPVVLFLGGLVMRLPDLPKHAVPGMAARLVGLGMAAGTVYPGVVQAILLTVLILPWLLLRRDARGVVPVVALVVLGVAMASGLAARPLVAGYPQSPAAWPEILARIAGLLPLEGIGEPGRMPHPGRSLTVAALWIGCAALALWRRAAMAAAFLLMPALLLCAAALTGQRPAAAQLAGLAMPAVLVGAMLLADHVRWRMAAFGVVALLILVQAPRFLGVAAVTVGPAMPVAFVIRHSDTERLFATIGDRPALLDLPGPVQWPLAVLALAGPGRALFFAPPTWRALFDYRHWAPPPVPDDPTPRIVAVGTPVATGDVVIRTRQFVLLRPGATLAEPAESGSPVRGLWPDGWIEGQLDVTLPAGSGTTLRLRLEVPMVDDPRFRMGFAALLDGAVLHQSDLGLGVVDLSLPLPESEAPRRIGLRFDSAQALRPPDTRRSPARLIDLRLE